MSPDVPTAPIAHEAMTSQGPADTVRSVPLDEVEALWTQCLERIKLSVPDSSFAAWFGSLRPVRLTWQGRHGELRLEAPSLLHVERVREAFDHVVPRAVHDVIGRAVRVAFDVADPLASVEPEEPVRRPAPAVRPVPTPGMPTTTQEGAGTLNSRYTFETFIEGDSNRLARSAALAIAEKPTGSAFNPFLVYGGVGLGKTHLIQAIGNAVRVRHPHLRVVYVSSETFTTQFVTAIQSNQVPAFANFYRQYDLLIVDDIQFFGGKEKTQEQFFHLFNALHQSGKQIVLSADRPPHKIEGLEERLLSRFQWGLSADVQPPSLEMRQALVERKAREYGLQLDVDVRDFIASNIRSNVRVLEGSLLRLKALTQSGSRRLDVELARALLHDLVDVRASAPRVDDIQRVVADFFGVEQELLLARTRKRVVVEARQVAMYLSRQMTPHVLGALGTRFGGRDHSTVLHACRTIENRMDTEPRFAEQVSELRRRVTAFPSRAA